MTLSVFRFAQKSIFSMLLLWGLPFVLVLDASGKEILSELQLEGLPPALRGRVLLEELNCVACHESDVLSGSSRRAPLLAGVGSRLNPEYLSQFIASPHAVKSGTTMPDMLASFALPEKQDIANAITHYLVSLNNGEAFMLQPPDQVAAEKGEALFHSVGCVACHSPRDSDGKELMADRSVPLGELHRKYSFASLKRFLSRPHESRPSGRMPDLRLPGHEVEQISHYLLRETEVPGNLAFTTWGGNVWEGLSGDVRKEKGGHVSDLSLESFAKGVIHHHTIVRYTGFLKTEVAGDYVFDIEMNGGNLELNGEEVINLKPSNRRGVKIAQGNAALVEGLNRIAFTYFHTGREPRLRFEMNGPGLARKQQIPAENFAVSDRSIAVVESLKIDPKLAARGKMHFEQLGCGQCHTDVPISRQVYPAMAEMKQEKGCLSDDSRTPRFNLSEEQRQLLLAGLTSLSGKPLSDQQSIDKTLVAMNCIACHERDGLGGISPERNPFFTGNKKSLGDQGRLPPPLTHVGAKLTPKALRGVLLEGDRQRRYLHTRMPSFGEANVGHLVERLAKVDTLENAQFPEIANIRESKSAGYQMMGATGLNCIACHDFNGQESGGAGALDLVNATQRLQKNWFHLYMRQPSRFHSTVIMPSYWPGGESIRKDVLDGNTEQQIEALWAYLSDGSRARSPKGLSRQSLELRVADETIMCRGRGTAGYRGIGVGYPERISLAFDSEEMALRQLWKGEFASINHGSFRARGSDRISFPPGIPFHRLASLDDSWPYKGKTDYEFPQNLGYQFRGYVLDKNRRPTFHYHFGEISVSDYFEDKLDAPGKQAWFLRTLTFNAPTSQPMFYFRAASGSEITQQDRGWKADKLNLRFAGEVKPLVRMGEPMELLVPVILEDGETILQVEYRW